jgi:glucose-6-phosphate 1-dehydrogenase
MANLLAEGLGGERRAPPCVLVVYGASGDLTSRKLLPAIASLHRHGSLPATFALVGTARTEMDDDDFRELCSRAVPDGGPGWERLVGGFRYVGGDYTATDTFDRLKVVLDEVDAERGTGGSRVHYLATVPQLFDDCSERGRHVKRAAQPSRPATAGKRVVRSPTA